MPPCPSLIHINKLLVPTQNLFLPPPPQSRYPGAGAVRHKHSKQNLRFCFSEFLMSLCLEHERSTNSKRKIKLFLSKLLTIRCQKLFKRINTVAGALSELNLESERYVLYSTPQMRCIGLEYFFNLYSSKQFYVAIVIFEWLLD